MIKIYYSIIPKKDVTEVYCKQRNDEIHSCKSIKTKREKFFVWKLLLYAMKDVFNANEQDITFVKSANGKWGCNLCHFSLSHSIDVVTVAISDNPIGLDVEKITPLPEKILDKILTVEERSTLSQLPTNQKVDFVIKTWTQKESCFKLHDIKTWSPQKLALNKNNLLSQKICVNNENYYVSICSETENTLSNDTIFNLINL